MLTTNEFSCNRTLKIERPNYYKYLEKLPVYFDGKVYTLDLVNNATIPIKRNLYVGIDQSSSCMGIAIINGKHNLLFDIPNQFPTKSEYLSFVTDTLTSLFVTREVNMVVLEEHNKHIPQHETLNNVTRTLFKAMRNCAGVHDVDKAPVNKWRKYYYDDNYDGYGTSRASQKIKCRDRAHDFLPNIADYYTKYCDDDYNCLEAFGIIVGYMVAHNLDFFKSNNVKLITSFQTRRTVNYSYNVYTTTKEKAEEFATSLKEVMYPNAVICLSDKDMLLDENIRRGLSFGDELLILYTPSTDYISIAINKELFLTNDTYMILHVTRQP